MQKWVREKGIPWPAPSFFHVRTLLCAALSLVAGIVLARRIGYQAWLWLVALGLFALAFLLRRFARAMTALALLGLMAFGLARGSLALRVPEMPPLGKWAVEGTVDGEVTRRDAAAMFVLRDVRVQGGDGLWTSLAGKLYCYSQTGPARLAHGQRVALGGTSYLPTEARNPGGFDQAMWLAQKGVHVRLYATAAPKIIEEAGFSVRGWALATNQALGARMDALFGQAAPVVRAMLLGDQREMPEDWSAWMRDSGISHLMAVSGLHVGLWFLLLTQMLRPFPLKPGQRWALLAVLLGAYALITGLKPSVLRAAIMLLMVQGAHVVRRKPDTLTALAAAALLILLVRPLDLFGAGFQLSFTAVLGIVLLQAPLRRLLPAKWGTVGDAVSLTVSAQLGILPAASAWFGTTALLGAALNLAAVPLAGVLVPLAALATALDALWGPLGWFFVKTCRGMVALLMLMAKLAANMPYAFVRVGAFAWWTSAAYFACMLLCSTATVWRWRWRAAAMAALAVFAVAAGFFGGSFWVRYVQLDVGQALSGVLHVGTKCYVYDVGDLGSDTTEYLLYRGETVDGLFLSHPHRDHVGGLAEMLDTGIPIKTIYVPANAEAFGGDPEYLPQLQAAQARGTEVVALSAGQVLDLGGVTATVIAPEAEATRGNDPNDRSLVLLLDIAGRQLMLMGDADGAAEPLGVDTDVLQVAHHGSRNAAREKFLADATPDIALVSTGRNSYGHPNEETLERLAAAGADIYITRDTGALTLYFMPNEIRVEAYLP